MAARPTGLASTEISVSLAGSKYAVTGALTRASFSSLTALSCWCPFPGLVFVGKPA